MHHLKLISFLLGIAFLAGCTSNKCEPGSAYALPGTNAAVVGIFIGKDGFPKETHKEVVLRPGEKVIYAGPEKFSIIFKNRKTPNGKVENVSRGGVVVIEIPSDIFERKEFFEEFRKNNFLVFDYGIRANGKETDPPIKVVPL
ncbi:MAG: hypothetical protein K0Q78_1735 [Cellvibrio sp.]|jgi:hypothetical protein|nr:hypothetical protein [Cellvibrio sp.]